ncbi:CDP-diacylglycerol--glycerol-3-phosphate 3-phosphatidyltransferase [Puccinia graminis f. sp. tritici]|uniref:CDP-diacylglycerol--glycerol-3-phosphate 3-phosphatidyltransferase n=1 Tax=Puccinia graminis f. sp. tritici TaxID=56615 RepID=A0A5B0MEA5_PUCGR|nr:CDP-diacylglycerol--glycerol-3-phosphate 3-phosphatidyltransferase [Puccinia graminis f. sp. tritici]
MRLHQLKASNPTRAIRPSLIATTRRSNLKRNCNTPPPPPPSTETTHEERDHRALDRLVKDLSTHLPHFRSPQNAIKVLKEPSQFYLELLNLIGRAKKRIFIASLYVGKEERNLIEALREALETNKEIKLTILVDYLRSTREHGRTRECSASLLRTLKIRFPDQVEIRLFHTSELFGILKRFVPRRFDEGFGLQHMKIYGADEDVIMSGANLSSDYFTNRQDRYIKLTGQEHLSEYLYELIELTSRISYRMEEEVSSEEDCVEGLKIAWPSTNVCQPPIGSRRASQQFKTTAHQLYTGFTERWRLKLGRLDQTNKQSDQLLPQASIFPTLQISPFKINHETALVIPKLINLVHQLSPPPPPLHLRALHPLTPVHEKTVLNWTSGYFSLLREYKTHMLSSNAHVEIITASPQANGFYRSNGVSKYIPPAYSYLENLFRNEIRKFKKEDQIIIRRWNRIGWTYHAKGLWINRFVRIRRGSKEEEKEKREERCIVTSIGSSNYGRRSAERDLECNLFIVLDNHLHPSEQPKDDDNRQLEGRSLSNQLVDELGHLKRHVQPDDQKEAHVGIFVKFFTRLIRNML